MRLLPFLAVALFATTAHAKRWTVDNAHSELTFSGAQAGDPFTGTFNRFTADIDFDPAAPENGTITITVDMASARLPDAEQNASLPTEDWFFVSTFPNATFTSTAIRATGKKSYEADGTLTIRDVSQPVTLPFTLTPEGTATRANGETVLMRQKFQLGGKQWADDKWIAYPVKVTYSILATPH